MPACSGRHRVPRLQLRTVIALVPSAPTETWAAWCDAHKVQLVHVPCDIYKEKNPVTNAIVCRALEVRWRAR